MTAKQLLEGFFKGKLNNNNNDGKKGNKERVCFQHGVRMLKTAAASDVSTRRVKSRSAIFMSAALWPFFSGMTQAAVGVQSTKR